MYVQVVCVLARVCTHMCGLGRNESVSSVIKILKRWIQYNIHDIHEEGSPAHPTDAAQ